MKTYPVLGLSGITFAFEVDNVYISCASIEALLSSLSSIESIRRRRLFDFKQEECLAFKYQRVEYIVIEPFGDNSRYWLGPRDAGVGEVEVAEIENVFRSFRPTAIRRMLGEVFTFNLFRRGRK